MSAKIANFAKFQAFQGPRPVNGFFGHMGKYECYPTKQNNNADPSFVGIIRISFPEAGHILYLRILYPIHIPAPQKDIIPYPYPGPKKGYGYISYILCQKFCQHCHSF
jgi:hypothetical protein